MDNDTFAFVLILACVVGVLTGAGCWIQGLNGVLSAAIGLLAWAGMMGAAKASM